MAFIPLPPHEGLIFLLNFWTGADRDTCFLISFSPFLFFSPLFPYSLKSQSKYLFKMNVYKIIIRKLAFCVSMVKRGRKWKRRDRRGTDGEKELEKRKEREGRRGPLSPLRPMVRREVCVYLKDELGTHFAKLCFSICPAITKENKVHFRSYFRERQLLQFT